MTPIESISVLYVVVGLMCGCISMSIQLRAERRRAEWLSTAYDELKAVAKTTNT